MSTNSDQPQPKVVDYGRGPHLYAGEVVGVLFDGATVNVTLGNLEARAMENGELPPTPSVLSICGKVTLSPKAAIQMINMLQSMLTTLQAQQAKEPVVQKTN